MRRCPASALLLIGEAAGIDPVTGEGIAQAIQYGAVGGRYLARKWAERNFGFADWGDEVRSTMVGRDLYTRTLGVPLFYGDPRPQVEKFLLSSPDFIRIGLQHFAGKRWSRARDRPRFGESDGFHRALRPGQPVRSRARGAPRLTPPALPRALAPDQPHAESPSLPAGPGARGRPAGSAFFRRSGPCKDAAP